MPLSPANELVFFPEINRKFELPRLKIFEILP